jgi:uncharacterized membrane protein HdeD (DUF308 family)
MRTPQNPPRPAAGKVNHQLLARGIACVLIGLAVLLAPRFIQSPSLQATVAGAYLVGWFSVVLGLALVGKHVLRRRG